MFPGAYDPDRIAITMAGSQSQLTYGEVEAFSNQFAHLCRCLLYTSPSPRD